MKKSIKITQACCPLFATLTVILALISCSSDDSGGGGNSNGLVEYAFCVFVQDKICLNGPMTTCQGGTLSNSCPYLSSSSEQGSSSTQNASSSSLGLSSSSGGGSGTFTDSRDGKSYKFVKIGSLVWMAESLNYAPGGKCYGDEPANCTTYGRLYDWATAMNLPSSCNGSSCSEQIDARHQGICPSGWHIPTDVEWSTLKVFVEDNKGCSSCDAKYLKAGELGGWDTYDFSALPGGFGDSDVSSDILFSGVGLNSNWWSASEDNSYGGYFRGYRGMNYGNDNTSWGGTGKNLLFSVRCLQD